METTIKVNQQGLLIIIRKPNRHCIAALLLLILMTATAREIRAEIYTLASNLATANSDSGTPGRPGLGSDGSRFLLVSCRTSGAVGAVTGLFGVIVDPDRIHQSADFPIAAHDCQFPSPAVAFDGTNYLVTYTRGGTIYGVRVSPTGIGR